MIALPLTFSGLIVAYGFILAYGRAGTVTQLLGLAGFDVATVGKALFTPTGLTLASSYYLIPRVVMVLLPVFVNFDRALLDAAASLARRRPRRSGRCFCPGSRRGDWSWLPSGRRCVFGAYGTALALVGTELEILPLQLYSLVSDSSSDFPAAAALALLITATCTSIIAVGEWASRGQADRIGGRARLRGIAAWHRLTTPAGHGRSVWPPTRRATAGCAFRSA